MAGPKVFILEADKSFAVQLTVAFRRAGSRPSVFDEAQTLMDLAERERPDLMIVAVEVHPINGFAVCHRLKKNNDLKDIPLFLTSDRVPSETFEQHARLRIRAEEYIRKPIAADEIIRRAARYIKFDESTAATDGSIARMLPTRPPVEESAPAPDLELSFDGVVLQQPASTSGQEDARPRSTNPPPPNDEPSLLKLDDLPGNPVPSLPKNPVPEVATTTVTSASVMARLPTAPGGLGASSPNAGRSFFVPAVGSATGTPPPRTDGSVVRRFQELESSLAKAHAAAREREMLAAEVARLNRELDAVRSGSARPVSAPTPALPSREFLELRETILRKEREIAKLQSEVASARMRGISDADVAKQLEDLQQRLQSAQQSIETDKKTHQAALAERDERQRALEAKLDALQSENAQLTEQRRMAEELAQTNTTLTQQLQETRNELERLKQERASRPQGLLSSRALLDKSRRAMEIAIGLMEEAMREGNSSSSHD